MHDEFNLKENTCHVFSSSKNESCIHNQPTSDVNEKLSVCNQIFVVCKVKAAVDNAELLVHKRGSHHPIL